MSSPDAANGNVTTQMVNYGTMETTNQTSHNSNEQNQAQELSVAKQQQQQQQEPPKPAVRQRILRLHKQAQEKTTTDQASITQDTDAFLDEFSTPPSQVNKDYQSIVALRMAKAEDMEPAKTVEPNIGEQSGPLKLVQEPIASKGTVLPLPFELSSSRDRPYPKNVLFIIANEFCERFSYYGLRAILVLYFKSVLRFSDSSSTVSFHLFATLCYATPILGAILADSVWGRFKTILYLSVVYLLGEIILLVSSVFWDLNEISVFMTFLGLMLIGIGTGGIKPCVCALGGDQFLPEETQRRESFFSLFYGAINLGALLSLFSMPVLRSRYRCVNRSDCYPLAFGVPCILMLVSILFFLAAAKHYVLVPLPRENVLLAFCRCTWLAFKRKLAGHKLPKTDRMLIGHINHSLSISDDTSSSSISSISSSNDITPKESGTNAKPAENAPKAEANGPEVVNTDHWLYLASDQYSAKCIEEFRSIWRLILIFLPTPVYWCLFDQQGSLWTLQATRMNGRIFGTDIMLEPDQMSVANPLLLLSSIPVFQFIIYPSLNKCNLLNTPIQKMSVGMVLAALTFIGSAIIELKIQASLPNESPSPGYANLLLVNGLSDCSINRPTVSYVQIPDLSAVLVSGNDTNPSEPNRTAPIQEPAIPRLEPLNSIPINLLSGDSLNTLNNYKFTFGLSNDPELPISEPRASTTNSTAKPLEGCPFEPGTENEFVIGPLSDGAVKLLYVEQGNGKLTYKLFNDSLELPSDGKARVRVLFEFFGSFVQAERRQFSLYRLSDSVLENSKPHPGLDFKLSHRNGQVLISNYMDVSVSTRGGQFVLKTSDNLLNGTHRVELKPGTRNLLIVQQFDAKNVKVKHEILQDNEYRISVLYQLIPYLMISLSEVMFSITGMELAYSMAPETMKSIVLAIVSSSVAFGNILTVAVESAHPFSNVVNDFLFYAALMGLDMLVFAIIGYHFAPSNGKSHKSTDN